MPLRHAPQNPSLAHVRNSPSLKSDQFSFAFVPLAEGLDPSTLVPATGSPTNPHHSSPASRRAPIRSCSSHRTTSHPHHPVITPVSHPDTGQPRPVSSKAPVHLTHSQQHLTTASHPAKPNLIPCSSSPALSLFKPGRLPAPVPHPDQDQPSYRLKSHLPLHVLQTRSRPVPKKDEAGVLQLLQARTSLHPWGWGTSPESHPARGPKACLKCRRGAAPHR